MKKLFSSIAFCFLAVAAYAQSVGIGTPTPNPRAILDLTSTNKGFLLPRVLLSGATDNTTIPNAPYGLMVLNQNELETEGAGVYIQTGTPAAPNWRRLGLATGGWALQGNSGAVGAVLGHLDNRPLQFVVGGSHVARLGGNSNILLGLNSGAMLPQTFDFNSYNNIAIGNNAMATATSGTSNIAIGNLAMNEATGGSTGIAIGGSALNKQSAGALENIAIGFSSQPATTSGGTNISIGRQSLFKNTTGSYNLAIGFNALANSSVTNNSMAIGHFALERQSILPLHTGNTAIGYEAMQGGPDMLANNGRDNTALGYRAMATYSNAWWNVAIGSLSLSQNTNGSKNVAQGAFAMASNTGGWANTAIGYQAAYRNITGFSNVAIGVDALLSNTTKSNLVAIGDSALYNNGLGVLSSDGYAASNTAVGSKSLYKNSSGYSNTALGSKSATNNEDGHANTAIGSNALQSNVSGASNTGLGAFALVSARGDSNTALGSYAGFSIFYGDRNTIVGANTVGNPFFSRTISGSTFVGYNAGNTETANNKLYIENSNATKDNALIYGDFAADSLLLNAKTINKFSLNVRGNYPLEIGYGTTGKQVDAGKLCYGCFGDPAHWLGIVGGGTAALGGDRVIKLWSEGGLRIKGNALPDFDNTYSLGASNQRWKEVWTNAGTINTSDATLKTNIASSPYGLTEVMLMNPVQYNWKTNPDEDLQIGFLAQDIQKIIPEAVVIPANGDPLGMKYTELIPVLVKAIQELQQQNQNMQKQIDAFKKKSNRK